MFTLRCSLHDHAYTVEAETMEEILSLALAAFEQNVLLCEICENDKIKYQYSEIYALIGRANY